VVVDHPNSVSHIGLAESPAATMALRTSSMPQKASLASLVVWPSFQHHVGSAEPA